MWLARARTLLWVSALMAGILAASSGTPVGAQDDAAAESFTPAEEEAIRQLVRDYLLSNPEILIEAAQVYRERQQEMQQQQVDEVLTSRRDELDRDPDSPVVGNPDGDVVVVEFFDYRCPYCKRMTDILAQLIEEDPNLRLVMKEYPILSQESLNAARAALAAQRQGKYESFHFALMEGGGGFTDDEIMAVADSVGLDVAQLQADMQDPEIEAALRRNHGLAERIGVSGTPAFIVGDVLLPGAVSLEQLRALIAEARAKAS